MYHKHILNKFQGRNGKPQQRNIRNRNQIELLELKCSVTAIKTQWIDSTAEWKILREEFGEL